MTNTRSLTWDLGWGIDYRGKLGPYWTPTSFKHRVRKCDLNCTWPIIGYTRIWYTGTSFLSKKVLQASLALTPTLPLLCCCFFLLTSFCAFPTIWTPVTGCGKLDHHISTGRERDGYKQRYVSVEFTKYGNTLFRRKRDGYKQLYVFVEFTKYGNALFQFSHGFLNF